MNLVIIGKLIQSGKMNLNFNMSEESWAKIWAKKPYKSVLARSGIKAIHVAIVPYETSLKRIYQKCAG